MHQRLRRGHRGEARFTFNFTKNPILRFLSPSSVQRSQSYKRSPIGSPISLANCITPRSPIFKSSCYVVTIRLFFEARASRLPAFFAAKGGTALFAGMSSPRTFLLLSLRCTALVKQSIALWVTGSLSTNEIRQREPKKRYLLRAKTSAQSYDVIFCCTQNGTCAPAGPAW